MVASYALLRTSVTYLASDHTQYIQYTLPPLAFALFFHLLPFPLLFDVGKSSTAIHTYH